MADVDDIHGMFPLNPVAPGKASDRRQRKREDEAERERERREKERRDKPADGHVDEYA